MDVATAQQVGEGRVSTPGGIAEADDDQGLLRKPGGEHREEVRLLPGQSFRVLDDQQQRTFARQGGQQPLDRPGQAGAQVGVWRPWSIDSGLEIEREQRVQPGTYPGRRRCRQLLGSGAAAEGGGQRGVRHGLVAASDQHRGAVLGSEVCQLRREPRLPHPGGATESQQPPPPVAHLLPGARRRREGGASTDHG